MSKHEQKEAVIYPLDKSYIERILGGKNVFCKYIGRGNVSIGKGSRLLLYASRSGSIIVGEAKVNNVEYLTADETASKYADRLFLTRDELERYRTMRNRAPDKKMLVLELTGMKRYRTPLRSPKVVTMGGQTLTKEDYNSLFQE